MWTIKFQSVKDFVEAVEADVCPAKHPTGKSMEKKSKKQTKMWPKNCFKKAENRHKTIINLYNLIYSCVEQCVLRSQSFLRGENDIQKCIVLGI